MIKTSKLIIPGVVLMAAIVGYTGGNLLNTASVSADSAFTRSSDNDSDSDGQHRHRHHEGEMNESKGGHVGKNGKKEELLTGETAEKVKAAALAAQPGATVLRVETDAEGSKYEAHIKKSDGSMLCLKFDDNFKLTATEEGHRHKKPQN